MYLQYYTYFDGTNILCNRIPLILCSGGTGSIGYLLKNLSDVDGYLKIIKNTLKTLVAIVV
jgi:hypothetical protein